jgi:hypothetical protein
MNCFDELYRAAVATAVLTIEELRRTTRPEPLYRTPGLDFRNAVIGTAIATASVSTASF